MWLWALACGTAVPDAPLGVPAAIEADTRPLTIGAWKAAGGPDVLASIGVVGDCPEDGVATGPDAPVVCATLPEIATVLNTMSVRDGLTPAFAIEGDAVTMHAGADGWRIPGCGDLGWLGEPFLTPAERAWVITDCPWPGGKGWRTEVLMAPLAEDQSSAPPLIRSPTRVVRRVRTVAVVSAVVSAPALTGRASGHLWVADRPLNRAELPASKRADSDDCWRDTPGGPAGCATIGEVAEALNTRSSREHLTPAFTVTAAGVAMDPLVDGYRLPTCAEALRLYGPPAPWPGALVDTGGLWEWTWCKRDPRVTPAFVAYGAARGLSVWESYVGGAAAGSGRLDSTPAERGDFRVARAVRSLERIDDGSTVRRRPLRPGGWYRRGTRLVGGAEVTRGEVASALGTSGRCAGDPLGDDLPATCVSPFDALRVLNAWSAADGLAPAYKIDADRVRFRADAAGWRLPTCEEVEADWVPPDGCPAGARLRCNKSVRLAPASKLSDGGRYGNVAELAWCAHGAGPWVVGFEATDVFAALGPSVGSREATLERRPVSGTEAAQEVGFRAVRFDDAGDRGFDRRMAGLTGSAGVLAALVVLGWRGAARRHRAWLAAVILGGTAAVALPMAWRARQVGVDYRVVAPDVAPPVGVELYDVFGEDAASLVSAMQAGFPYPGGRIPHAALDWEVAWEPVLAPDVDGTCRIAEVDASLRIWGAFPRWWSANPDPVLALAWREYLDALAVEAHAHRDAGERFEAWLRAELPNLPPGATCDEAKANADTWVAAARAEIRTGTAAPRRGRWRPSDEVPGEAFNAPLPAAKRRR